jgi:16S rRNA U1498 N3-methylase RsmE
MELHELAEAQYQAYLNEGKLVSQAIRDAVEAATQAERERCAKIAESNVFKDYENQWNNSAKLVARMIREQANPETIPPKN